MARAIRDLRERLSERAGPSLDLRQSLLAHSTNYLGPLSDPLLKVELLVS